MLGFLSEVLALAGTFLIVSGFVILGSVFVLLGILGGITRFFYYISKTEKKEELKINVYTDVKTIFISLLGLLAGDNKKLNESDSTNRNTIH